MEGLVGKSFEYGLVGVVVAVLLFILYKVMMHFVTRGDKNGIALVQAQNELVKSQSKLAENTLKLSSNVDKGSQLILLKIQEVHQGLGVVSEKLKDIATKDVILGSHQDIIRTLDDLKKELKILIENK